MKQKFISFITILLLICYAGWTQSIKMHVCTKDGIVHIFNIDEIRKLTFASVIGVNEHQFNTVIKNFYLLKSYPNPFNSSTTISYTLPHWGIVEIIIVDLNGKIIQTLHRGNQSPGEHTLVWNGITGMGKKVQTGVYFCNVKFNNQIQTNKMVLIK